MATSPVWKQPNGQLLRLGPTDNVAVATAEFKVGETVWLNDTQIQLLDFIPLGHKVAIAPIAPGQKIYKYGCPIGSATRPIRAGEHVHVHNLKSDYLPTFVREEGKSARTEFQT
jgi:hypothetical protein